MRRKRAFEDLVREASACERCERMLERKAVLSHLNGSINASILLIAEAPGRNGADRTRIPFHGDASGVTFEKLLASVGLTREDIFITNSVLCSPRKPSGANDKPNRRELGNCADFLRRQIALFDPKVVVTLGAVALDALKRIESHDFALRTHAARITNWNQRLLVPLYHPSPQVIAAVRPLALQIEDFKAVRLALEQATDQPIKR